MTTATSTIVFVDVVGSTALRARLGEDAADRLFRAHQRALGEVVSTHLGRVVSTSGDGIMAAFDSATDAVRAAVAVQQTAHAQANGVRLRVGVAAGDVSWEDGDCFGLPVVTAARLEAYAEAGQILVSALVRYLAGDRSAASFEPVGALELKGLPAPVDTFEVAWSPPEPGAAEDGSAFTVPCPAPVAAVPAFAFVGREAERHQLDLAWAAVQEGQRHTVLIGGEAGAGKTRLAFEFARRRHAEGATVLLGGCDAELALPYQPWVQVLEHLVRAMPDEVAAGMADDLAEASVAVPQLERLVPGLRRPPSTDPETERYRLFNAMDAILADAARRRPTVVVIDDLHWAGAPTLALLRHLARAGTACGLLVIGTFRDTGDEVTEPLAGCLADLRRTDAASRLRLSGLDQATVERFVANEVGHELGADLCDLASVLARHSGGNAFYLGELWRHLVSSGAVEPVGGRWVVRSAAQAGVPDSVREVVADRLTRLSGGARRVVELAAVAGQSVELRVLSQALDLPTDEVGAGLDELVEAKLLAEVGGVRPAYQFAHAIVHDTVEASVPSSPRAQLHRRLAEAYESTYEADRRPVLAQLARHFTGSVPLGTSAKAVYYLRRAANQALRSVAYEEAIGHLEVALELDPPGEDRVDILLDLGEARSRHGPSRYVDPGGESATRQAMAIFADAFRAAREVGSVHQAAQAAAGFDQALHIGGLPGAPAVEIVSEALAWLGDEDSPLRTRLQSSLARALALAGRNDEAEQLGAHALAAARRHGDPQVLVAALECAVIYSVDPRQLIGHSQELADLAVRLDDPWAGCYARGNELRGLLALGRVS